MVSLLFLRNLADRQTEKQTNVANENLTHSQPKVGETDFLRKIVETIRKMANVLWNNTSINVVFLTLQLQYNSFTFGYHFDVR